MTIIEYKGLVRNFILDKDTSYALMLDGSWGTGKTHFWKENIVNDLLQNDVVCKEFFPIHISLNGKSKAEDIRKEIFEARTAALFGVSLKFYKRANTAASFITKVFKGSGGIDKIMENIAFDEEDIKPIKDTKDDTNKEEKDSLLKTSWKSIQQRLEKVQTEDISKLNKFNKFILCIDDLERCQLPIKETWGIISHYVETDIKTKVIILTDSDKIDKDKQGPYKEIKEKVVGRDIKFHPTGKDIVESFVKGLAERYLKEQSNNEKRYCSATFLIENYKDELINSLESENINFRTVKTATKTLFEFLQILVKDNRNADTSDKIGFDENGFPSSKKLLKEFISQTIKISLEHSLNQFDKEKTIAFIKEKKRRPFDNPHDISSYLSPVPISENIDDKPKIKDYQYLERILHKIKIKYDDANEEILLYVVFHYCNPQELLRLLKELEIKETDADVRQAYEDYDFFNETPLGKEHIDIIEKLKSVLKHLKNGRYYYRQIGYIIFNLYKYWAEGKDFEITEEEIFQAYKTGLDKIIVNDKIFFKYIPNEVSDENYPLVMEQFEEYFKEWKEKVNSRLDRENGKLIYQNVCIDDKIDFDKLWKYYQNGKGGFFSYLNEKKLLEPTLNNVLNSNKAINELISFIKKLNYKNVIIKNHIGWKSEELVKKYLSDDELESITILQGLVVKYQEQKHDSTKNTHLRILLDSFNKFSSKDF